MTGNKQEGFICILNGYSDIYGTNVNRLFHIKFIPARILPMFVALRVFLSFVQLISAL